jgi:hypothetical protein
MGRCAVVGTAGVANRTQVDRIDKLVQGYLEQTIDPDKVKSEPIPKKNPGPLFAAVADNLMETVMQPDADVVIHFYSRADDRWARLMGPRRAVSPTPCSVFCGPSGGTSRLDAPRSSPETLR